MKNDFRNIFHFVFKKINGLFRKIFYPHPSKRYKYWKTRKENKFLSLVDHEFSKNEDLFSSIFVSIIMPVYNRDFCIEKAINSVISQTHQKWSLIIIDDGSNDNTEKIISKYLADSRIKLFKQKRKGVSKSRNQGLSLANHKYIFYLDSDNMWHPRYLFNMIIYLEKGNLDAAYSGMRLINDNNKTVGYYGQSFNWRKCWEFNYIDINCFAHHRKFIDQGFRFDENLKRLVDWDFILRLTANSRTSYAPFLGVEYYDGTKGNRITFNEYPGDEINRIVSNIRDKYTSIRNTKRKFEKRNNDDYIKILNN